MNARKIVVLGTGGTIAGTAAAAGGAVGYRAAQLGVAQLLQAVPGLADATRGVVDVLAEQLAQVDSKDMSLVIWRQLALRCAQVLAQPEVAAVLITHGTDTLEETVYFLQAVLRPTKPVVITCAMRPADAPAPDGPQNLLDAVAVALDGQARGVVAVCAGAVHGALDVRKSHTYRLDAFDSGDAGPLAYVEGGRVRWLRSNPDVPFPFAGDIASLPAGEADWPRVDIVTSYAGASAAGVEALVASGAAGLVVAGTGNGTVHRDLEAALLQAQAAGVRVLRSTRCAQGRVLPRPGDAIADSEGLSPVKARVALMLALCANAQGRVRQGLKQNAPQGGASR